MSRSVQVGRHSWLAAARGFRGGYSLHFLRQDRIVFVSILKRLFDTRECRLTGQFSGKYSPNPSSTTSFPRFAWERTPRMLRVPWAETLQRKML
jgi:hypothetical protein